MKARSIWVCQNCQQSSSKWSGQCHHCKAWNSLLEQSELPKTSKQSSDKKEMALWRLQDVPTQLPKRLSTGMGEIDRLLGEGIVPGSLILLGGEPGIGKSTLLLQLSAQLCAKGLKVLYVSGEESIPQITLRAQRLKIEAQQLLLASETRCSAIRYHIEQERPALVVIDSIQIIYREEIPSAAGSVVQVRECAAELLHLAKSLHVPIILIGHVTKSGELAGPRILEHMVDTVLYFESDLAAGIRMIRSVKNRFGATDELALLQMTEMGLQEIVNPSALFLQQRQSHHAGSVVVPVLEGSRVLLVEAQALVSKSFYPQPTRRATGFDPNRLALLLAVMEKKVGLGLHSCDVFVAMAGGLKIDEPAMDLGVAAAITSSLTGSVIDPHTAVMAEVGLSGQLRPVARPQLRIKELAQLGFRRCICAAQSTPIEPCPITVTFVSTLKEGLQALGSLP